MLGACGGLARSMGEVGGGAVCHQDACRCGRRSGVECGHSRGMRCWCQGSQATTMCFGKPVTRVLPGDRLLLVVRRSHGTQWQGFVCG